MTKVHLFPQSEYHQMEQKHTDRVIKFTWRERREGTSRWACPL